MQGVVPLRVLISGMISGTYIYAAECGEFRLRKAFLPIGGHASDKVFAFHGRGADPPSHRALLGWGTHERYTIREIS